MAWEVQGKRRFYYRSRRVGRTVKRDYYGDGVEAHLAAALDQRKRRQRQVGHAERQPGEAAWGPWEAFTAATKLLLQAALLAAGYRQHHKGEGRKTRACPDYSNRQ